MRIIETKVYTIEEHPNKDLCFNFIRNNWHDLNQHSVYGLIDSIKALQKKIGGKVDYSLSLSPCSGDYISFEDYDKDILKNLDSESYPLTGTCWDFFLIESLNNRDMYNLIKILHDDTEHCYSNEGLEYLCIANMYEFKENGEAI
jgi:hypothetical protein